MRFLVAPPSLIPLTYFLKLGKHNQLILIFVVLNPHLIQLEIIGFNSSFHFLLAQKTKQKRAPYVEVFFWQQGQKITNQQLNFFQGFKNYLRC